MTHPILPRLLRLAPAPVPAPISMPAPAEVAINHRLR